MTLYYYSSRNLAGAGNHTEFSLNDIRTQRHLVLSTMKAAILDGGDLSVQLFMRVSRHLPVALCSAQYQHLWSQDRTTGFIRITRVYRFTFVDTSTVITVPTEGSTPIANVDSHTNEQYRVQCFSPLVLDSLVRGVFFSMSELEMVKSVCRRYSAARTAALAASNKTKQKQKHKRGTDEVLPEDIFIRDVIHHYCKLALTNFDQGDFVISAGWMMLIQSFVTSYTDAPLDGTEVNSDGDSLAIPPSYCMSQLSSLTAHVTGKLQSSVNSTEAVIDCVSQIVQTITALTAGKHKVAEDALPDLATDIYFVFDGIGDFLSELREIVQCVNRDILNMNCSDAKLVVHKVVRALNTLFHSKHLKRPLLPKSDTLRVGRRGLEDKEDVAGVLLDMSRALKALDDPLREVATGLKLLCASIAGDVVLELVQMDADCRHRYKTPYSRQAIIQFAQGAKDTPNPSWMSLEVAPKTFSELLGMHQNVVLSRIYSCV